MVDVASHVVRKAGCRSVLRARRRELTMGEGTEAHPEPVELVQLRPDEAHLLEGLLKEAGIEADVLDSDSQYGATVAFLSRVFVNKDQLGQAQEILREFNERQGDGA
jgi:hypothetical protein